ncbi:MAG: two-component system LytT family response regulator [Myxococcota bacterium]|jgi:two-component system LytT family response regulator
MSTRLTVVIADDELLARKRLQRLTEALDGVDIVAVCDDGASAVAAIRAHRPDLALLDIQMPGLNGLDVGGLVQDVGVALVFVTAHSEHAAQAFDLEATDYVVKPVDATRLQRAVERVRTAKRSIGDIGAQVELSRLPVQTRRGVRLVPVADISHALFDGEIVTIYLADEALLTDFSLQDLERRLPAAQFMRVGRRGIIKLAAVSLLEPQESGGYQARMDSGGLVAVSRQAARRLRRLLGL